MGLFDDIPATQAGQGGGLFDDIPVAKSSILADVAKTIPSGLARGVAGVAGLPRTLDFLADHAAAAPGRAYNYLKTGEYADTPDMARGAAAAERMRLRTPETETIAKAMSDVVPALGYKPQTLPGKLTNAAAEFIPAMAAGPGSALSKIGMGAAAGLASEGAGQAAESVGLGGGAARAARVAGGLVGGGLAAGMARPSTAQGIASQAMRGVDDNAITAAGQLMQQAHQQGIALTWPEAISAATQGGSARLSSLARVVENSEGGSGVMAPFMAQRPAQIENAARANFNAVAPVNANPSRIGSQIGEAAQGTVADVTEAINRTTRPLYQAAEVQRIGPQVHQALMADPLYAQTLQEVRNNPSLNRTIAQMPDDAVGVVDLVQRRLREAGENAAIPGQASSSNLAAANFNDARTAPIAAAETVTGTRAATPTAPAQQGAYELARQTQAQLRQQYLEPLMAGPIGKMAQKDLPTQKAIEALFPTNPLPNSAREIVDAVGALNRRNPEAARDLVRAHVESVFNESMQALPGGANQFGGAGFAAVVRGNTQQAQNLAAAIHGIGGPQLLQGFDNFLDVLSATGQRQRAGSLTAFNQEAQTTLKRGGAIGEVTNAVASGGIKLPARIRDAYERYRLGTNTEELANLFTDPNALATFRQLARAAPGTTTGNALTLRLLNIANGSRSTSDK